MHLTAKRVAEQFATKLLQHIVKPLADQIVPQSVDALKGSAVAQAGAGIDRIGSQPADGVVLLERKTVWVNELMALDATGLRAVPLDQLAGAQTFWHSFRQIRYIGWWPRQSFAKQRLVNPVSTKDGARARCAGVARQHRGQAEHTTAPTRLHTLNLPPLVAAHAVNAVMPGQTLVQERMIGVEQIEHRAIVAKHVLEKPHRLLIHGPAQFRKLRVELHVLVIVFVKTANVKPLTGELLCHAPCA